MSEVQYKWNVFVSHNRLQKPWVRRAVRQWRDLGLDVFFDEDSIVPGDDIVAAIETGIESSEHVVLIMSPSAFGSRWVAMETAITIFEDPDAAKRRLIPVLLETVDPKDMRVTIRRLKHVDLTDPERRRVEYHGLLRALGTSGQPLPEPPPWEIDNGDRLTLGQGREIQALETDNILASSLATQTIEITLSGSFDSFSDDDQDNILRGLREFLRAGSIKVVGRRPGSVKLILDLPEDVARRLVWGVKEGYLAKLGVLDARLVHYTPSLRVLLIDDEAQITHSRAANYVKELVANESDVTTVVSVREAFERTKHSVAEQMVEDVVVLDMMMPVDITVGAEHLDALSIGEFVLRRALRDRESRYSKVPVLVLTNRDVEKVRHLVEGVDRVWVRHKSQVPAFHLPDLLREIIEKSSKMPS